MHFVQRRTDTLTVILKRVYFHDKSFKKCPSKIIINFTFFLFHRHTIYIYGVLSFLWFSKHLILYLLDAKIFREIMLLHVKIHRQCVMKLYYIGALHYYYYMTM